MEVVKALVQIILFQCVFEVVSSYKNVTKDWLPGGVSMFGAQLQEKETRNKYQCENLCKATSPCLAVSYSVRTRICSLFKEVPAKDNMSPSIYDISISDIRELTEEPHRNRCQNGSVQVKSGLDRICLLAGVSCGPHPILPHADVTGTSVTYNSIVTYACHTGYTFEGSSLISRCTEDGSWSLPLGSCTQISCGQPPDIANAEFDHQATTYGSTATYTCNEGYVFDGGDPKTICSVSGVWGTLSGSCKQISCGEPREVVNARVDYTSTTYGSTATYRCSEGYVFDGRDPKTICTISGDWSALNGSCEQISCGEPREVVNARVDYTATTYGSTATYTCGEGYVFHGGDPKTICTISGDWSALNGSCEQISCGEPREVVNARVDFTATTYRSTATYTCSEGYVFNGRDPKTICTISGDWSALNGSCERTLEYLGCYMDDADRILDGYIVFSLDMTIDRCFEICRHGENQYAGLEAAFHCHCGNTKDPEYDQLDHSLCTSPCGGNQTQICGGHWRMSLYKLFYVI